MGWRVSIDALLFRKEVLEKRSDRLQGEISLAIPMSWQAIGILLLAGLGSVIVFLATATYSQVETVSGSITLDKGVAQIIPSRAGIITAIPVSEGQEVHVGDPLVLIRSGEFVGGGGTAPEQMKRALTLQDARLAKQIDALLMASSAERGGLVEQIAGLKNEIKSLTTQIDDQQRLVDVAFSDYQRLQTLAAKRFASKRDLEAGESTLVSRRQQLAQLEESRSNKLSSIATAEKSIAAASANAAAQIASTGSDRAELNQQLAQIESAQGYTLVSPVDGVATGITARVGQTAGQQPLMMVIPARAIIRAELYVPTAAAGFLKIGQPVRLAIDAFPYDSFGTIDARIDSISSATIHQVSSNGTTAPVYLISVSVAHPWVMAFGRKQPLLPGMTLTGRVTTRRRSLLEWLFEPIFAVSRR